MVSSRVSKKNNRGFTLVEVIVVAVIVAVLALVGIQLYQGYVTQSRQNAAENLAAQATSFLQTVVNSRDVATADALPPQLTGLNPTWSVNLGVAPSPLNPVSFNCPNNAIITKDATTGEVTVQIGTVYSTASQYYYKTPAAAPPAPGGGS